MSGLRVLVGSPVRKEPSILKEFLWSLQNLELADLSVDFLFVDDNESNESTGLLRSFSRSGCRSLVIPAEQPPSSYKCNEQTHFWNEDAIWHVAALKDIIIEHAKSGKYDYLFLVDADLVLHPRTLRQLIAADRDIISEIFWTKWQPGMDPLPQVWLKDQYTLFEQQRGEQLTADQADKRLREFLSKLREPGVYEVGGLGACTLISKKALEKGVSFAEIYNLSLWGEDRHFCIRAVALGFRLYVDTHCPAYHIYRESELAGVADFKRTFDARPFDERELLDVATYALETFWSQDYRTLSGLAATALFHPAFWEEIASSVDDEVRKLQENRVISKTKVTRIGLRALDLEANEALVAAEVVREGVEAEQFFSYSQNALVLLNRVSGTWFVRNVQFGTRRDNDLPEVLRRRVTKHKDNKLTLAMLVRNEADRYLHRVLQHASQYIDEAVILDDGSEDNTVELCRSILAEIPHVIVSNPATSFSNEVVLRKQLWNLVVDTDPDWILCLDADEMFEDRAVTTLRELLDQPFYDNYAFRLYDFWDMESYREDAFWQAHKTYRIFLTRYQPGFVYTWRETPQHCGRFPENLSVLPTTTSDLRIKHFGWASAEDRIKKHRRYMELDPEARFGIRGQYESILSPNPHLVKWVE